MIQFRRADRVGGLVQKELSALLLKKIKDPRLHMATITRVNMSDDLRSARIYFAVAEGKERSESVLEGFISATGYLRRELSRRLQLRHMPQLNFRYDDSFDRAANLEKTLREIKK